MIFQTLPRNSQSMSERGKTTTNTQRKNDEFRKSIAAVSSSTFGSFGSFWAFYWRKTPHSSPLACEVPRTEEPGGLQSMGWLRVGHGWVPSLSLFTSMHWRRRWQPTPVFLPGESQGRGSLVGCRLWGRTELDTTEATSQQRQSFLPPSFMSFFLPLSLPLFLPSFLLFLLPHPCLCFSFFLLKEKLFKKKKKKTSKIKSQTWTLEFCLSP